MTLPFGPSDRRNERIARAGPFGRERPYRPGKTDD